MAELTDLYPRDGLPIHPPNQELIFPLHRIDQVSTTLASRYKNDRTIIIGKLNIKRDPAVPLRPDTAVSLKNASTLNALDFAVYKLAKNTPATIDTNFKTYDALLEIALDGRVGKNYLAEVLPIEEKHPYISDDIRAAALILYADYPDLVHAIAQKGIIGGHATRSGAIPGIFEYGLRPQNFLERKKILMTSGFADQGSTANGINRDRVSFLFWTDRGLTPESLHDMPVTPNTIELSISELIKNLERDFHKKYTRDDLRRHPVYFRKMQIYEETTAFLSKPDKTPQELEHAQFIQSNFPVTILASCDNVTDFNIQTKHKTTDDFTIYGGLDTENLIALVPQKFLPMVKDYQQAHSIDIPVFPLEALTYLERKIISHKPIEENT